MKKIMVAWVKYQRRADCMQEYWGYDLRHIYTSFGSSIVSKPLDYIVKIVKTFKILFTERPDQLWIQLPPSLLLHIAFIYKFVFKKDCAIIADLHNSMLRDKWMKFPFARALLNKMDVVLAHNKAVSEELKALGINENIVQVLEDYPFQYDLDSVSKRDDQDEKYIIFPCSFDIDEPIETVLKAAKLSDINFYITGNSKKFVNSDNVEIPKNVIFTNYLSKPEYDALLLNATMVLGMTTRQNVQLSVANEGLSACKPLILSNTTTLRDLYSDAAQLIDNDDPESLAGAIQKVLSDLDGMAERTKTLMQRRTERWKRQAATIMYP